MFTSSKDKGKFFEQYALEYLLKYNLSLVKCNYHCKIGEIDLIMLDSDYLVFVEVRYRKNIDYGHPLDTINYAKQNKLIKTAEFFLQRNVLYIDQPSRFDVISITNKKNATKKHDYEIEWLKNVIYCYK